jgi:hypothetical protein
VRHLDELRAVTKCRIVPNVAGRTAIARGIARFYEESADLGEADGNFKVVDAQGRTVVKHVNDGAGVAPASASAPSSPSREMPSARGGGGSAADLLRNVEEVQRKEVAALKAMVELLIEKGIFSREEYLAKVRR